MTESDSEPDFGGKSMTDKNRIAIATMTWGRDEQEESLLREALTILGRRQITTFVADGGSGKEFIDFLQGLAGFHVFKAAGSGVFPQIKHSLRAAHDSGAEFILYCEPDKKLFFDAKLHEFLLKSPSSENVGVVLASRSKDSFSTFPEFQQYTESVINNLCAEVIGDRKGDYTYGPFLFNRKLIGCLDLVPDDIGWGWRPFLFAVAKRKGFSLVRMVDDYPCPLEQRTDDASERIYRMKQLQQNIEGLILSTKVDISKD